MTRRSTRSKQPSLRARDAMASATAAKAAPKPTAPSAARKRKASGTVAAAPTAAKKTKASKEEPVKKETTEKKKKVAERPKPSAEPPAKKRKAVKVINEPPTKRLKVFVFGEGANGELGLGATGNIKDVKRPRLNPFLLPDKVGVVHIATGGMHAAALTHDNQILTWGVNDQSALGRDTTYDGGLRDMDADSDDEDSENGLNPRESTPGPIDLANVPAGTVWSRVSCGDSVTFAITNDGLVYGCGTFRSSEGILGFSPKTKIQGAMVAVEGLKDVVDVVCGANHALALDSKGNVFSWGSGQQMQLGRRIVERNALRALVPSPFGLPRGKTAAISSGAYHSFAIDTNGDVWSWGLNSFGETGHELGVGESEAVVIGPTKIPSLAGRGVKAIAGGAHHSIAADGAGALLAFGRADSCQAGLDVDDLARRDPEAVVRDDKDRPRIISRPTVVPGLEGVERVAVGIDTNIVVTSKGRAFSWGFSANYQTGLGTEDDVAAPTLIDNTATREQHLIWAGAGGQYGMLVSEAKE